MMPSSEAKLLRIRAAIANLCETAQAEGDSAREHSARWVAELFAQVQDAKQLRSAAREALKLYRGGMGSFSDVGTAQMEAAVEQLRRALRSGASLFRFR